MADLCFVYHHAFAWNFTYAWIENARARNLNIQFVSAASWDPDGSLAKITETKADAYFFMCGDMHLSNLFDTEERRARLQALQAPLICYANESILNTPFREMNEPKARLALDVFDHFFSQDENDLALLRSRGASAEFMAQFADSRRFVSRRAWEERPATAFSFGQTSTYGISEEIYRDRRKIVEDLEGFDDFVFIKDVVDTTTSPDSLVDLFNDHRIAVCLPTNVGGITNRFYEAALCGSTILHYELHDQPLSSNVLRPGVHCLTYDRKNPEDLRAKIRWLIENPKEARALALNAYQYVMHHHTVAHKLAEIMTFADVLKRDAALAQERERTKAVQTVLEALRKSVKPRNVDRKAFQEAIAEASRAAPNTGPASVRHKVLLEETRRVLGISTEG